MVSHLFLPVREAKAMSLELFGNARSIAFLAVEDCSKGILVLCVGHGKSPCFSRCPVLRVVGVDWRVLVFVVADGGFFLV
jgi:hypothetical protein